MDKPRILLVPMLTQLEWRVKHEFERWAEVASYDAPGIAEGSDPMPTPDVVAEAGLRELDELGWERCTVVADEFGVAIAARIAEARPEAIEALALGHARLSNRTSGARPAVNPEVRLAFEGVAQTDHRSWVRAFGKLSAGEGGVAGYDEEFIESFMELVRPGAPAAYMERAFSDERPWDQALRSLQVPMLLVEHRGCLLFTRDGYEDAVAALPEADTDSVTLKPSASPEFAERLREFCSAL